MRLTSFQLRGSSLQNGCWRKLLLRGGSVGFRNIQHVSSIDLAATLSFANEVWNSCFRQWGMGSGSTRIRNELLLVEFSQPALKRGESASGGLSCLLDYKFNFWLRYHQDYRHPINERTSNPQLPFTIPQIPSKRSEGPCTLRANQKTAKWEDSLCPACHAAWVSKQFFFCWVAVKELKLAYHNSGTLLFGIHPSYGKVN